MKPSHPQPGEISAASEAAVENEYKNKLPPKLIDKVQNGAPRGIKATPLSLREIEVVLLISHGASYKQAAEELGIGVETVKSNLRTAKNKLNAINTTHLVRRIFEEGYIE